MEPFDSSKWIVDPSDFEADPERKEKNRDGSCGVIHFCIQKNTNRKCVKKQTQQKLTVTIVRKHFDREVKILAKYNHPAIVPFIGYYEKKFGYIYLELMENGSLERVIEENNKENDKILDLTQKLIIAYGVAAALEFLHSSNVLHRDLKPLNILVNSKFQPFVTDFDLSKEYNPNMSIYLTIQGSTVPYMSPEFFEDTANASNTKYIDIYAYGVTIYKLITGLQPFDGLRQSQITAAVLAGRRPNIPDYIPEEWKNLITDCWDNNPEKRPPFSDICDMLESDKFLTPQIDKKRFNEYKNIIKPKRPVRQANEARTSPVCKLDEPILPTSPKLGPLSEPNNKSPISLTSDEAKNSPQPSDQPITVNPELEKLRIEARGGNYQTQLNLANALFQGTFGPPDYEEAKIHFLSVANIPDRNMKYLYVEGEYGFSKCLVKLGKFEEAKTYLTIHPIAHGNYEASYLLAEMMYNKQVTAKPGEMAFFYKKAADAGNADAIVKYATLCLEGKVLRKNEREANKYLEIGSNLGIPEMMHKWGIQLEFGRGVNKDVENGMFLLKRAAEFGCVDAQFDYAMHLFNGLNIEKDTDSALNFFKIAAANGHQKAMLYYFLLEDVHDDDHATDMKTASECLEKCFIAGNIPDAFAVKGQLLQRQGQITKSIEVLEKGAEKGSLLALLELGRIYLEDEEDEKAADCFEKAAKKCHSMKSEELVFKEPIRYKVFHCDRCNKDVCEACARHCHKEHDVKYKSEDFGFVCNCSGC